MKPAGKRSVISTLRWSAPISDGPVIHEIDSRFLTGEALASALTSLSSDLEDCRLLLARIDITSAAELDAAIATAEAARFPARICLAIDCAVFAKLGIATRGSDRVGVLLDKVDGRTALLDIASEEIEGVRFRRIFVDQAATDLRNECILDAMLGLAKQVGLATFGPAPRTRDPWLAIQNEFDYVPAAKAIAVSESANSRSNTQQSRPSRAMESTSATDR